MGGTNGRRILTLDLGRHLLSYYVCHVDQISFERTLPLVDWKAGLIEHTLQVCDYFFQRFN